MKQTTPFYSRSTLKIIHAAASDAETPPLTSSHLSRSLLFFLFRGTTVTSPHLLLRYLVICLILDGVERMPAKSNKL